ncbi:MAG: hypothetical protein AUF67_14045 [Acidobacteria bacterium 13_1_20CM_58_21]|nr:MAG: hypothetical protein AUF67_14045 [Acidobacteria bacterium 13_1_20CM_58_21]
MFLFIFLFIYLPSDISPGVNMLRAALEVSDLAVLHSFTRLCLGSHGHRAAEQFQLGPSGTRSFAIDRCRRRLCHCYSAPFWLDTLNKFSVVRSTIKPREKKSHEEHSKNCTQRFWASQIANPG